jgi:hypothetical protein
MKPLPLTRELLHLAQRLLPAKRPEDVLGSPRELIAQAAEAGSKKDIALLIDYVGEDALREAAGCRSPADPTG